MATPEEKRALLQKLLAQQRPPPPKAAPASPSIRRRGHPDPVPLSHAQQGLWYQEQLSPGTSDFNIPVVLRITGALDAGALEAALTELVRRHEVLRTAYRYQEGGPLQHPLPPAPFPLRRLELESLPADRREAEALRLLEAAAREGFDLAGGQVVRAVLARLGPQDHALMVSLHNIAIDSSALGVLFEELHLLYGALSRGRPSPLTEPGLQYADFATFERENAQRVAAQLPYWVQRLTPPPAMPELVLQRPSAPVPAFQRALDLQEAIPPEAVRPLRELARKQSATFFMAGLAVLEVLLRRYTAQPDIAVGTTIEERGRAGLERMVGCFQNTLVLRSDLSGDPTFRQLLDQVRTEVLGAFEHQAVPFQKVVEAVHPERTADRMPLVNVIFNVERIPSQSVPLGDLRCQATALDAGRTRFQLAVRLLDRGGDEELRGLIAYRADLYHPDAIRRLWGHLRALITAAAATPDLPISRLSLVSPPERALLLSAWNQTARPRPEDPCFHHLVEEQARLRPEAPAVEADGETLSYAQLDRRANRLAHTLRTLGAGPDRLVGLCVAPSADLVVGWLGILKSGAACLPLDPAYPEDRLQYMLQDSRVEVVVTQGALAPGLPLRGLRTVDLEALAAQPPTAGDLTPPPVALRGEHLAYAIYTSGSTGRPKGVLVPHRGLRNVAHAQQETFSTGAGVRVAQIGSPSFDASTFELTLALGVGGVVCIPTGEARRPGAALAAYLAAQRVDAVLITPSALRALPPLEPPALPVLISCGEALSGELAARWSSGRRMFNAYGPSEGTIWSSTAPVPPRTESPSVGHPIGNVTHYVLDSRLEPTPVGVAGELYVGGVGVVRGYLGRPDTTAEKFVPDPFGGVPGARLYRTGDLARFRADGALEFIGRTDDQVKIRGVRIELGEVEARLAEHPQLAECAVVTREGVAGKQLWAFYVTGPGEVLEPAALRTHLRAVLPEAMLPHRLVPLPSLPVTPNGKLDRRALELLRVPEEDGAGFLPPHTPTEQRLAALFAALLSVPRVGRSDNFFELGGDSLLSIQLVDRAAQAGLRVTASQVLTHQTLEALAAAVDAAGPRSPPAPAVPPEEGGLPALLPIQAWFAQAVDPAEQDRFNQGFLVEVSAEVEPARLWEALAQVQQAHPALRLRFTGPGLTPSEARPLLPPQTSTWELGDPPDPVLEAQLTRLLHLPFPLEQGPLLRGALLELGARGRRLLLVAHHLVVDGVSWRILLEDLERAYRGQPLAAAGRVDTWARAVEAFARSGAGQPELPFWREMVAPAPSLPGGTDGDDATPATLRLELDPAPTRRLLQEAPRALEARVQELLLTALLEAFGEWSGQPLLRLDLEGHGRMGEALGGVELGRTVGWLTALHPLRLELPARSADPLGTLRSVQRVLARVPHGGVGYGALRYLSPDPTVREALTPSTEAQVLFNYLGQADALLAAGGLFRPAPELPGATDSERRMGPYRLEFNAVVLGGRLRVDVRHRAGETAAGAARRLGEAFLRKLAGLIDLAPAG